MTHTWVLDFREPAWITDGTMARTNNDMKLGERSQYLFKLLVERYIANGQPDG